MTPHQRLANALYQYLEQRHDAAIERTRITRLMAASVRLFDHGPLLTHASRRLAAAHLRKAA
ncbi:hypothetical protein [Nocardiopsis tropica]|uniref:Uncharacterized protein n=1 Tax=Nocardiopsis tropica TaxID=109330 RepID=A0ABU7KRV8_9ACTN|nr:hypothetical protein [Nocardiopsis umidischolae]MEE2051734.1 hypothetical protein [Nocardiopsis umidischolae]